MASLRTQIQELQGELTKANERVPEEATKSQQAQVVTEPVGTTRKEPEQVEEEALQTGPESEKVIVDGFRVRVNDYGDKDRNRVRVC